MNHNTIVSAFRASAAQHASYTAVKDGVRSYSYKELDQVSSGVGNQLLKECAGKTGLAIGLYFSHEAVVIPSMLGVLKSGNMYVPLDKHLPDSRLRTIVTNAAVSIILTTVELLNTAKEMFQGVGVIGVDFQHDFENELLGQAEKIQIDTQADAYMLYTSGTSGQPKGIVQSHGNVVHHCTRFADLVRIDNKDTLALTTSFSHTVAVIDIFSTLFKGGCVAVYDLKANADLLAFREFLVSTHITIVHCIPSLYRIVFSTIEECENISAIRLVVLGGEDVHIRDFELFKQKFSPQTVFVNLYGSTELIIATACLMNKKSTVTRSRIPVGYPIEGVTFKVVDEANEYQGTLRTGEIVFQSRYISPGCKNALSTDSLKPSNRIYKSGDLGRTLTDGSLELMGRSDTQIKINGNRIELQEIEVTADRFTGIEKAVIKAFERSPFEKFIVCFYTVTEPVDATDFRVFLSKTLPAHMMPEQFVELTAFPRTATNKIDRARLGLGVSLSALSQNDLINPIEKQLAALWAELLQHNDFGPHDQFLIIGGNSLKLSQLHLMINEAYGNTVSVQDLLDCSSLREMAKRIEEKTLTETVPAEASSDIEF